MKKMKCILFINLALLAFFSQVHAEDEVRKVIDLNGTWQICNLPNETMPSAGDFNRMVPVPGLVDMATPAFPDPYPNQWNLSHSPLKDTMFVYRKTFKIDGAVPAMALLQIDKAKYGCKVYLNGEFVGSGERNFTRHTFNVTRQLRGNGAENELFVCIGAHYTHAFSHQVPNGRDPEKITYIPGIYDDVKLMLIQGNLYLENIQVAPNLETSTLHVQATLKNDFKEPGYFYYTYAVKEVGSGKAVATGSVLKDFSKGTSVRNRIESREPRIDNFMIKLNSPHLWSTTDPFLYTLELKCTAINKSKKEKASYSFSDNLSTRFGFREFHFDPQTGTAMLNGKRIYLRGSNICMYRFFEDPDRGDKPWSKEWARKVIRSFKNMHWNSCRYCIGFPPEIWYEVADEEGLLIMDEYPIWYGGDAQEKQLSIENYVKCFQAWMRERWNHPSVVVWDAQNETWNQGIANAVIAQVRGADLSDRPWDVGWEEPARAGDSFEQHKYYFQGWQPKGKKPISEMSLREMATQNGSYKRNGKNVILNEYGWLWLNRDGSPTVLSKRFYDARLPHGTPDQRRELYARNLAMLTEVFRSTRELAGLLHFCGLGYNRPDGGATSDNYIDLETPTFDPFFYKYVRDSFSPVGLMLDLWDPVVSPDEFLEAPVVVINDNETEWSGELSVGIYSQGKNIANKRTAVLVPRYGKKRISIKIKAPREKGTFEVVAELKHDGESVKSYRQGTVE